MIESLECNIPHPNKLWGFRAGLPEFFTLSVLLMLPPIYIPILCGMLRRPATVIPSGQESIRWFINDMSVPPFFHNGTQGSIHKSSQEASHSVIDQIRIFLASRRLWYMPSDLNLGPTFEGRRMIVCYQYIYCQFWICQHAIIWGPPPIFCHFQSQISLNHPRFGCHSFSGPHFI